MSSANQKTETESWLFQDKHYENEKCGGIHQCFRLPLPEKLACHSSQELMVLDAVSLKGHPWLDWLGILA